MLIEMDMYQLEQYLIKVLGYGTIEAETLSDYFYEATWDSIDVDKYLSNGIWYIVAPDESAEEIIQKEGCKDYSIYKADNGYSFLEIY